MKSSKILATKENVGPGPAYDYLVDELKKAALECCLVEKTEAMTFLINNDYIFKQELNGCSREYHDALKAKLTGVSEKIEEKELRPDELMAEAPTVEVKAEATGPTPIEEPQSDILRPEASSAEAKADTVEPADVLRTTIQESDGDPFAGLPPIKALARISNDGTGQRQMENTRKENPIIAKYFEAGLRTGLSEIAITRELISRDVPRSILACLSAKIRGMLELPTND